MIWHKKGTGPRVKNAQKTMARFGYDWSLSDVEDACKFLDHPELTEEDSANYHGWADPYPRRCYCSAIAYTNKGRVYAIHLSDDVKKIHQQIFGAHYPDGTEIGDRCGEPYIKKKWKAYRMESCRNER